MFWGLVLEPGKRYAQTVDKAFHISMASLDTAHSENDLIAVNVNFKNAEFILCNLQKNRVLQTPLDLNFMAGDKVAFFTSGKGRVHLTGYLIDEEMSDELEDESDASVEEEIQQSVEQNKQGKRKLPSPAEKTGKKQKIQNENAESEEEDEDSDIDALESGEDELDSDEDEVDDEEEESEDDGDSDESEEEVPQKQQQAGKKNKQIEKVQQGKQSKTPPTIQKKDKVQGAATPKTPNAQLNGTPEKQSGKKNKKKGGETPGEKDQQTPKTQVPQTPGQTPQKKILEGGVAIEDVQVGSGPVAKPGRFVTVYYSGRLKQNNKKFDETMQGPGFKFRLGKGEVIKGWDIGVAGMKVGGKRKLTIPPHMGYGAKGSPPVIPPNSALVFEVELRNVN